MDVKKKMTNQNTLTTPLINKRKIYDAPYLVKRENTTKAKREKNAY